jgi:hypothetical protein
VQDGIGDLNMATRSVGVAILLEIRMSIPSDYGLWVLLARLAEDHHPSRYLEIGVREGGSLMSVLSQHHPDLIALCDTWGGHHGGTARGSHAHIEDQLKAANYTGYIIWMDGKSQELVPALPTDQRFDLINVDGDHDYAPALADLRNAWARCDGVMAVDDSNFSGVRQALDEFAAENGLTPERFTGGYGVEIFRR